MKVLTNFLYKILNATLGKIYTILRYKTTYNEDGLATFHVASFLTDSHFQESYQKGKETGTWTKMDIRWRAYVCCWAADKAKKLEGDFVECGVFKGGLSRVVVNYVSFEKLNKKFYLLDTYEGMPVEYISKEEISLIKPELRNKHYTDTYSEVKKTFQDYQNVKIVKGKIPDSLSEVTSNAISYLSIDLNNYIPEIAAIRFFWDKIVPGGIVILDDYCYSDKYIMQRMEWDKFAAEKGFKILSMPTGQGLIIK